MFQMDPPFERILEARFLKVANRQIQGQRTEGTKQIEVP
jgi:hypothetical protein